MGCDIIMSVPWHCGDKDCPVGWHKADYWLDEDAETGYTVDHYSDGDHELVEESELPSWAEEASAWREYARDVAFTGKDPLGNYLVKHSRKVRQRWEFRFTEGIIGAYLAGARRAGKVYRWHELPDHVRRYLNIEGSARLRDFDTWDAFIAAMPKLKLLMRRARAQWYVQHIEYDQPRNPVRVKAELVRAAKRHLKCQNEQLRKLMIEEQKKEEVA